MEVVKNRETKSRETQKRNTGKNMELLDSDQRGGRRGITVDGRRKD